MEKEYVRITTQEQSIDPDEFWGDEQRIIEIIGEGSGDGFRLEHANLPINWEMSLDKVKRISLEKYAQLVSSRCETYGYDLKEVSFDSNKILTKLVIGKNNSIASMELGGGYLEDQKAKYKTENLTKIGSAVLMQSLLSEYLSFSWSTEDFDYGRIGYSGDYIGGFFPIDLKIPRNINIDGFVTNDFFQQSFMNKANNIAGRFGVDLKNIQFTENGLLNLAEVEGVNGCYYSLDRFFDEKYKRQYHCHNVDSYSQSVALHGIVASYINFLIDKESRK